MRTFGAAIVWPVLFSAIEWGSLLEPEPKTGRICRNAKLRKDRLCAPILRVRMTLVASTRMGGIKKSKDCFVLSVFRTVNRKRVCKARIAALISDHRGISPQMGAGTFKPLSCLW